MYGAELRLAPNFENFDRQKGFTISKNVLFKSFSWYHLLGHFQNLPYWQENKLDLYCFQICSSPVQVAGQSQGDQKLEDSGEPGALLGVRGQQISNMTAEQDDLDSTETVEDIQRFLDATSGEAEKTVEENGNMACEMYSKPDKGIEQCVQAEESEDAETVEDIQRFLDSSQRQLDAQGTQELTTDANSNNKMKLEIHHEGSDTSKSVESLKRSVSISDIEDTIQDGLTEGKKAKMNGDNKETKEEGPNKHTSTDFENISPENITKSTSEGDETGQEEEPSARERDDNVSGRPKVTKRGRSSKADQVGPEAPKDIEKNKETRLKTQAPEVEDTEVIGGTNTAGDSDLPSGWSRRVSERSSGAKDFYVKSPAGQVLRSQKALDALVARLGLPEMSLKGRQVDEGTRNGSNHCKENRDPDETEPSNSEINGASKRKKKQLKMDNFMKKPNEDTQKSDDNSKQSSSPVAKKGGRPNKVVLETSAEVDDMDKAPNEPAAKEAAGDAVNEALGLNKDSDKFVTPVAKKRGRPKKVVLETPNDVDKEATEPSVEGAAADKDDKARGPDEDSNKSVSPVTRKRGRAKKRVSETSAEVADIDQVRNEPKVKGVNADKHDKVLGPDEDSNKSVTAVAKKRGRPKKVVSETSAEVADINKPAIEPSVEEVAADEDDEALGADEEEQLATLSSFLASTSLGLRPHPPTRGDGNCWYRAAAAQVWPRGVTHTTTNCILIHTGP